LDIKGQMKREIDLNIMSNSVCAVAWNFLSTQNFEHEIWNKKKLRKILPTW
jgi:hypothetical protein